MCELISYTRITIIEHIDVFLNDDLKEKHHTSSIKVSVKGQSKKSNSRLEKGISFKSQEK